MPGVSEAGAGQPAVVYRAAGRYATLELNRSEHRNALSAELLVDFHAALDEFEADPEAGVAILKGRGPSFCSGFDLGRTSPSTGSTIGDPWADRRRLGSWMELAIRIWEFPRPIVAQVHGHCIAGGVMLLLAADVVFVSDDCVLGWPRLPMGAGFMDGAMSLLVGQRRAKEISYTVGSQISGQEAAQWGLANQSLPEDQLEERAKAQVLDMARTPRNILEIRKASINRVNADYRDALLAGVEWDVIAHGDPAVATYRSLVRKHGMKAVIEAFESSDDAVKALEDE
jgi:enoyl-CoA hydratase